MTRRLSPLFARVILRREKFNHSSIIIPDEAQKRNASQCGIVESVGPTCEDEIRALVGKKVLFGLHAGTWIDEDGKSIPDGDWFICQEEDLLVVIGEA